MYIEMRPNRGHRIPLISLHQHSDNALRVAEWRNANFEIPAGFDLDGTYRFVLVPCDGARGNDSLKEVPLLNNREIILGRNETTGLTSTSDLDAGLVSRMHCTLEVKEGKSVFLKSCSQRINVVHVNGRSIANCEQIQLWSDDGRCSSQYFPHNLFFNIHSPFP